MRTWQQVTHGSAITIQVRAWELSSGFSHIFGTLGSKAYVSAYVFGSICIELEGELWNKGASDKVQLAYWVRFRVPRPTSFKKSMVIADAFPSGPIANCTGLSQSGSSGEGLQTNISRSK